MSSCKLVSVVTGTWQRHDLLLECIENVRQQTYPNIEHVVVSDGQDDFLAEHFAAAYVDGRYTERPDTHGRMRSLQFTELGFWSSGLLTDSVSAAPFMVAQLLARGDYQIWWADDERALVSDHIERLVDLLETYEVDFVYPRVELTWPNSERRRAIGSNPPQSGQFTHCLYRRQALDRGALFRLHVGDQTDWDACARMVAAGCKWAFLDDVTFTHRVDK